MGKSQEWIERAEQHVCATYGRYPMVAARGEGCKLWDVDGKEYLDFLAGVAVNNLGHCHPKVVEAIQKQAATLIHCSNFYHIPQQIALAELLCNHSFGEKVFFCNSGAEANEAAIKLVRKYSFERHGERCGEARHEVITAQASFHGRTIGAISATGQDKVKAGFYPLLPGFVNVPFGDIESMRLAVNANTCAIMLEPVQGEGGVNIPPAGYLKAVRELCDEQDLLLIFDEVQSGCGRTGKLFGYQHEDVEPDVMTLAKALAGGPPVGAMVATSKVAVTLGPGTHGSTFGGNPLMMAAALASMEVLLEGAVLDNCREMGGYLEKKLIALRDKYPFVREIRGIGLIWGMELDIEGGDMVKIALGRGLLINCTVGNVIRFLPPLVVTTAEIDRAIDILDSIMAEI